MADANHKAKSDKELILVTGNLGAGKSTVLGALEDLGWEIIDNFPIQLLDDMVFYKESMNSRLAVGFDTRTRGFDPEEIIKLCERLSLGSSFSITTMFLECSNEELERRYNETRRRHNFAINRTLHDGIIAERELLAPLRNWAETIIDTTDLNSRNLQKKIRRMFSGNVSDSISITVSSFGFKNGRPPLADLTFDMRFLKNPYWVKELQLRSGLDREVADYIKDDPGYVTSSAKILDLLVELIPRYQDQEKVHLHIAFGCTGGQHRSVFSAEEIATGLRRAGFSPNIKHRDLDAGLRETMN
jgi:UPF0042 nucleotide-binding protein